MISGRQPAFFGILVFAWAVFTGFLARATPPANGLVAYYPLNGNANDASGHNLDGTALNTTAAADRFGNATGALLFDGNSSYIDCGNRPEFKFNGSFSIAAWVKLNGDQSTTYVVGKYDFANATNAYGLGFAANSVAYTFLKGDVATYQDIQGGPALSDGKWHLLTMVYDDQSGLSLFVDGGGVGSYPRTNYPPFADETPLLIGRIFSGQFFGGAIDDVLIYNRALTAAEIAEMGPPPQINVTLQPRSGYTTLGNSVTLRSSATVSGGQLLAYQWFKNDEPIPDATNAILRITRDAVGSDRYKIRFTAGPTVTFSDDAILEFGLPAPAALLARYNFETGADGVIVDE